MNTPLTINNPKFLKYLTIVIFFSSWIIYYTIPRGIQYVIFFIPSIILIFYYYPPNKQSKLLAFSLFSIVIFRFHISPLYSIDDIEFYAAIIRATLLSSLFLLDNKSLVIIYSYLKKLLFLILLLGIPLYLLHASGLMQMYRIGVENFGEDALGRVWNIYPFFNLEVYRIIGEQSRFGSIFDEPGYLGVLMTFILIIEKFDLQKLENKIFLLAGLLTFSVAFYLSITIYLLLSLHIKFKHKLYYILIGVLLFGISAIFFPKTLEEKVFARIISNEGNMLETSGRIGIERQMMTFEGISKLPSDVLLFGAGFEAHDTYSLNIGGVTWERLIFQLGLVFTLLFLWIIFYSGRKSRQSIIFAIIFVLSLLHRPAVFSPIWFFLLICGLFFEKNANKIENEK